MHQGADTNKYIGIGRVSGEPKVKYLSKVESYIIEFGLEVVMEAGTGEQGAITCTHPILVRNERLALFLKDTLKERMRIYLEGCLVPYNPPKDSSNKQQQIFYRIEANEILIVDAIERSKYPDEIKKIR